MLSQQNLKLQLHQRLLGGTGVTAVKEAEEEGEEGEADSQMRLPQRLDHLH
jgi:hypothetical protein